MQPFDVKLDYRGRPWCTVKFELGHNEIGDADEPEYQLADGLVQLFTAVGLEAPKPVPVICVDHQVAQKLHALSEPGSERVRDLVDLQLLEGGEDLDLPGARATCERLFAYRRQQPWPPAVEVGDGWATLYEAAVEDVNVLTDVEAAVDWVNGFVEQIARASGSSTSTRALLSLATGLVWRVGEAGIARIAEGQPDRAFVPEFGLGAAPIADRLGLESRRIGERVERAGLVWRPLRLVANPNAEEGLGTRERRTFA